MRWKPRPEKERPAYGTQRVVRKFIWFPKCLYIVGPGRPEWRWLEVCTVVQEFERWLTMAPESPSSYYVCGWRDRFWDDNGIYAFHREVKRSSGT